MVVHAENEQQKKVIAMHICTGIVCKNCLNYSKSTVIPNTGRCHKFNKSGLINNDFCSLFEKKVKK